MVRRQQKVKTILHVKRYGKRNEYSYRIDPNSAVPSEEGSNFTFQYFQPSLLERTKSF
jgi:hypothetical protein